MSLMDYGRNVLKIKQLDEVTLLISQCQFLAWLISKILEKARL
jgi:hypothetical protein